MNIFLCLHPTWVVTQLRLASWNNWVVGVCGVRGIVLCCVRNLFCLLLRSCWRACYLMMIVCVLWNVVTKSEQECRRLLCSMTTFKRLTKWRGARIVPLRDNLSHSVDRNHCEDEFDESDGQFWCGPSNRTVRSRRYTRSGGARTCRCPLQESNQQGGYKT